MIYHILPGLIMAFCFLLLTVTFCIAIFVLIRYFWHKGNKPQSPPPFNG